ncbi:hypothetical protein GBP88_07945 [Mycobacterium avium subsp. hominissuis]|uniref:DUF7159 domain-containing protein n=3 Tax=Mycobacterium avium complex (MAC) TaxID=120793 RepID=A0A3B6XDC2_MYCAV|nr:hypothetical protein BBJ32_07935 [Mycobacterium avium]AXO25424.1 hypothetical protein DFS55_02295 [Mycobacterium avium subsp. hominissuis]AZP83909.1 hypothetical protein EGA31_21295 [Mycobacterium avium subsp. paratuberculosis]QPM73911.1 hypothetical protein MAPS_20960 [Mycobacterium avium subsp. paratuberculosis S397]TXA43694.1 hypothetical protein DKM27_00200 [Mycobacterium tuberculosis variant bovis]
MSMAPTAVRMVLVEGENGDGATVDEDNFDVATSEDAATVTASDQVLSAILGTRQGAAEGGYQLASTGVTFTDPVEAAALRDKLAAHKVENVMLVSAFLAAAALAQAVGHRTNYAHTALLYIEPDTATLAVVDSADGSIADVRRQPLPEDDEAAVAELASMVSNAENLETRPDAVFVVGSGIDIPLIKPALEAATTLPLTAPEEPDTALARGAALASAHAPLFASSTAALAYAQDPGTGAINPLAVAPGYFETPADAGADGLAYSAVPDDPDEFFTGTQAAATELVDADYADRSSFKLVGSAVAAIFVIGVVALVVSLAIAIRPTANVRPSPNQNVVVAPTRPAPAAPAPAPAPEAPAPAPAAAPQAPAPAPEAPAPAPAAPAPAPVQVAPVPVPEAPAPAPAAPPPPPPAVAPIPVPIPLPIPGLGGPGFGGPPGHGGGDGGGHGGGGFPGFPGGGGHGGGGFPGFGGGHGGFGHH